MSSWLRFSDTIIVTMWRTECHSFFGKFCNLFAYFCFFWNFLLSHSIFAEFRPSHDSCWPSCLGITLVFPAPYTLLCSCLGILLTFLALIPTTLLWAGYYAYFSCSNTHNSAIAWVTRLLLLNHTHKNKLNKITNIIKNNKKKLNHINKINYTKKNKLKKY